MTKQSTLALTAMFAGALVLAPELLGQELPGRPQRPADRAAVQQMRARMMQAGGGAPAAMLLRLRDPLALTADQVTRLESMAATQRQALQPQAPELLRARADLLEATSNDIDLAAARRALDRMAELRTSATIARLTARKEARDVLTAEQRGRLDALQPAAGMRGVRSREGIRGSPQMRGMRRPGGPPASAPPPPEQPESR